MLSPILFPVNEGRWFSSVFRGKGIPLRGLTFRDPLAFAENGVVYFQKARTDGNPPDRAGRKIRICRILRKAEREWKKLRQTRKRI